MTRRVLLVALVCGLLTACFKPRPVPPGLALESWASPSVDEFSVPEVGALSTGQVGETLVRAGVQTVYDTIVLDDQYRTAWPRGDGARDGGMAFKRGARLFLKGHAPGGTPVYTGFPPVALTTVLNGSLDYGLGVAPDGTVRWLFAYGGLVEEVPGRGVAFRHEPYIQARETDFVREFIYNGRTGDTVFFTYREFLHDLARPAFTQDIIYELDPNSRVVGFRNLQIGIFKATNTDITYRLIRPF